MLENILKKDFLTLSEEVSKRMNEIASSLIEEIRVNDYEDMLFEARIGIVNRVRNGKIQRRHKVSNVSGYRFQDGRLVRMSPREQLNRKRAQRKGALKRKTKMGTSIRRRQISIRRRGRL